MKYLKIKETISLTVLLTAITPAYSVASQGLEEVTVTARRTSESLQDVPLSVTAIGELQIENRSITDVTDVGKISPNLSISVGRGSSAQTVVYMRGVGQNDDFISADSGVGIYLDDVFISRNQGSLIKLSDVERIEVLRGPQGTLYGKNTVGGAIKVVSKKPHFDDTTVNVTAAVGSYGQKDLKLSGNLPLGSNTALRLSLMSNNNKGFMKNLYNNSRLNDADVISGRLQFRYQATDDLEFNIAYDNTRDRSKVWQGALVDVDESGFFVQFQDWLLAQDGYDNFASFETDEDWTTIVDGEDQTKMDNYGISGTINWNLGGVDIESITAYRDLENEIEFDVDNAPCYCAHSLLDIVQDQLSQEIKFSGTALDRLDWTLGFYYFEEFIDGRSYARAEPGLRGTLFPIDHPLANVSFIRDFTLDNDAKAVFLHGVYRITDRLDLTLGGRYTEETKSTKFAKLNWATEEITYDSNGWRTKDFDNFSGKVSLDYDVNEETMVYATLSEGYKSGGYNARGPVAGDLQDYNPETVLNYEVGIKSRWFDNKLQLNASAFFMDYDDIQLTILASFDNGEFGQAIKNVGKAEVSGLELEIEAMPTDNLRLTATAGLLEAEYKEYQDDVGNDFSDNDFVRSPETMLSFGVDYSLPLSSDNGVIELGLYGKYQSTILLDESQAEAMYQSGYSVYDARVGWRSDDGAYSAMLVGKNITDKKYLQSGMSLVNPFGVNIGYYGLPRTLSLELRANF